MFDFKEGMLIRKLIDKDIPDILALCKKNRKFYKYCPPFVSEKSIKNDMETLPPGKKSEDKYYIGFWKGNELLAIMDLVLKYPNEDTAFIGFFMTNTDIQRKGIGTKIIAMLCNTLKEKEYRYIRLGYMKGNKQSKNFWIKNDFLPTGDIEKTENYEIIIMQKNLLD